MAVKKPGINRLLEFQKLLADFQAVKRVTQIPPQFDAENDIEHSYTLAMTAWFLAPHFPALNVNRLIRYALVHDLVEVHAGDTYIYGDKELINSKAAREAAALKQLERDWPDFPDMTKTIHDYERRRSAEAKFIYALDKIMPIMLVFIGQGHTWQQEGITPEALDEVKRRKVKVSPEIQPYYNELYELLLQNRHYFTGKKRSSKSP